MWPPREVSTVPADSRVREHQCNFLQHWRWTWGLVHYSRELLPTSYGKGASSKAGDCMLLHTHERYTTNTYGRHTNTWREKRKRNTNWTRPTYTPLEPLIRTQVWVSPGCLNSPTFNLTVIFLSQLTYFFPNFLSMPDFAKSFVQVDHVVWNWSWGFWLSSFSFWKA